MLAISVLTTLFQDFAARLCSTEFLHDARYSDHPTAFSRCRKLPLQTLVAIVLTGMRMSIQAADALPASWMSDRTEGRQTATGLAELDRWADLSTSRKSLNTAGTRPKAAQGNESEKLLKWADLGGLAPLPPCQ